MKTLKSIAIAVALIAACSTLRAEDKKSDTAKAYPLDKCVVSGEKLGEMGKPYVFKHEGREVQLCCKSCLKDFNKDPKKYLAKLDEAAKAKK